MSREQSDYSLPCEVGRVGISHVKPCLPLLISFFVSQAVFELFQLPASAVNVASAASKCVLLLCCVSGPCCGCNLLSEHLTSHIRFCVVLHAQGRTCTAIVRVRRGMWHPDACFGARGQWSVSLCCQLSFVVAHHLLTSCMLSAAHPQVVCHCYQG